MAPPLNMLKTDPPDGTRRQALLSRSDALRIVDFGAAGAFYAYSENQNFHVKGSLEGAGWKIIASMPDLHDKLERVHGYIARRDGLLMVAWPGSESWSEALNLRLPFLKAAEEKASFCEAILTQHLCNGDRKDEDPVHTVLFVGHGDGGIIATLSLEFAVKLGMKQNMYLITFGAPQALDGARAEALEGQVTKESIVRFSVGLDVNTWFPQCGQPEFGTVVSLSSLQRLSDAISCRVSAYKAGGARELCKDLHQAGQLLCYVFGVIHPGLIASGKSVLSLLHDCELYCRFASAALQWQEAAAVYKGEPLDEDQRNQVKSAIEAVLSAAKPLVPMESETSMKGVMNSLHRMNRSKESCEDLWKKLEEERVEVDVACRRTDAKCNVDRVVESMSPGSSAPALE